MSNEYGFGIIGVGMIANFHAQAIGQIPNARVAAACDVVPERAEDFAKKYNCKAYSDIDKMLADDDVHVVTVCTPSGSHMDPVLAAARAGKHAICEKPIEITLDRIDRMIEAHDKAGTKLGGIFNSRQEAVNRMLKETVDSGRLGTMVFAGGYVPWHRSQEYYDTGGWKGTKKFDGGGALMNQGAHTVDLVRWLAGPVKRISAFTNMLGHKNIEVEDIVTATLEFESGALGTLMASTAMYPGEQSRVELAGTDGTVISEVGNLRAFKFRDARPEDDRVLEQFSAATSNQGGASDPSAIVPDNHRRVFEQFIEAVEKDTTPPLDGHEARKAVEIILAVYKSAETGKPVTLPL